MNLKMAAKLDRMISDLLYQYPRYPGASTYGQCSVDGCNNTARGSRACPECLEKELAAFLGSDDYAASLHSAVRLTSELIHGAYDIAERRFKGKSELRETPS